MNALLLLGVVALSGCASTGGNLVTVRSVVDPAYLAARAERPPAQPETFVVAKGRLRGGSYPELAKLDFAVVARTLAADLTRAGYRPAADNRSADIVVVVHWGVTEPVERAADLFVYDPDSIRQAQDAVDEAKTRAAADAGTVNSLQSSGAVSAAEAALRAEAVHASTLFEGNDMQSGSNADLLGFREVLQARPDSFVRSDAADTLSDMAEEERYFAVLIAYDGPAARRGERRRLWTTRMSIGTAGQSFTTGLDAMSNTAATSHGRPQTGILITPTTPRPDPSALPAPPVPPPAIAPTPPPPTR